MEVTKRKCVILVTGASGFLGQHVVSALSKYADHVTEIRVFDKIRYENKMVYPIKKEVRHFVGDLLDRRILTQACNDVDSVIHLAGYIDMSVRPNIDTSRLINVEGTRTLLEVSKAAGVKRFIYCSSTAVAVGLKNVLHGTEDSVPVPPPKFLSFAYGTSKYEAEKLVLEANREAFRTIALRPGFLYGEHNSETDRRVISRWFWSAYVPELSDNTAHEWVYAGNVAWAFIRAEISLYESYKSGMAGEAYFICDDTPVIPSTVHYSVHEICFEDAGLKPVMPLAVFRLLIFCIKFCLYCFCCIQIYVFQTKAVIDILKLIPFRKQKFRAISEKAKRLLGYEPMYSFKEAKKRTTAYVHSLL